ncbi:hypothetical protein DL93DRAFT_2070053 [Clavulina sp. PMI_390]|nr:hypothetical protein DL93DRAFT_2070053 [Clavulina sp. PMI_390]
MVFLLYLAAPQTEGSTYIYKVYMNPFLNQHEDEIDRTIGEIKVRIFAYAQAKLRAAWDALYGALLSQATSQQAQAQSGPPQPGAGAPVAGDAPPPSMMDPMSGPAKMAWGLWQSYGPTVVARGATLLAVASAAAQNGAAQAQAQAQGRSANAEPPSISRSSSSSSSVPRRADEGVELATISPSAALAAHSRTISQQSLQAGGVESAMKGSLYLPADAPEDSNGRYEQIDHDELNEDDPLLSPQSASTAVSGGGGWFGGWGKPAEKTKTE